MPYVFVNLKLHDIVTDTYTHVSCMLNNANIVLIKKNANIFQLFFYILDCVLLIFFSLDFVSIVAKVTKFEQEYHI